MLSWIWERLPEPAGRVLRHTLARLPVAIRYGPGYRHVRRFLKSAEWWDAEEIEEWQLAALRQIVGYAAAEVPGYHEIYAAAGIEARDIRTVDDIRCLPIVTKEVIRDNLESFTSRGIPRRALRYVTTGGSTGIPFGFYQTPRNRYRERAFMHLGWERAGWIAGDRVAVLRGEFVGTPERFWRLEPHRDELALSTYHLSEDTIREYLGRLQRYNPVHLRAYPSAAMQLARLLRDQQVASALDLTSLLLGSENLYAWQVDQFREAFPGARVFAWYGHAEQVLLGAMCEFADTYHMWPFYGLAEVLDTALESPVAPGGVGELVGTSFWNTATPFIRYRTMDRAEFIGVSCDECGRQFPIIGRIDGRLQELAVTSENRRISMTAINMHTDLFDHVRQFQFYQDTVGKLVLKVVPKDSYSDGDTARICNELGTKLGSDMDLTVALVDDIPCLPNGKYRFLDQRLTVAGSD